MNTYDTELRVQALKLAVEHGGGLAESVVERAASYYAFLAASGNGTRAPGLDEDDHNPISWDVLRARLTQPPTTDEVRRAQRQRHDRARAEAKP